MEAENNPSRGKTWHTSHDNSVSRWKQHQHTNPSTQLTAEPHPPPDETLFFLQNHTPYQGNIHMWKPRNNPWDAKQDTPKSTAASAEGGTTTTLTPEHNHRHNPTHHQMNHPPSRPITQMEPPKPTGHSQITVHTPHPEGPDTHMEPT